MHLLPSILITATLIGGSGNIQTNTSCTDNNVLQNQRNDNCVNSQVIIGNVSDIESLLNDLGIHIDFITDCIKPCIPDTNPPEIKTPDNEINNNESNNYESNNNETNNNESNNTEINNSETSNNELNNNQPNLPIPEIPNNGINNPDENIPNSDTNTPDTNPSGNNNTNTEQNTEKSYIERVVELVNIERAKVNLPALTMSDDLNKAAAIRAKETTQSFSHTRPNGTSFSSVLKENGISYRGSGENIAWGQRTPEAVVNAWMNSAGHRANILNKNYTSIGVGYYQNSSTPYWTQLFTY